MAKIILFLISIMFLFSYLTEQTSFLLNNINTIDETSHLIKIHMGGKYQVI